MPLETFNNMTDRLAHEQPSKLNLKLLLWFAIGSIIVGSTLFGVIKGLYEGIIDKQEKQIVAATKRAERAEECCLTCKTERIDDFRDWTSKLDTLNKKVTK